MGKVRITEAGYLYFDFSHIGIRCKEYTELRNTPENQKVMNEAIRKIESEIRLGTFDYEKYFPNSRNAEKFASEAPINQVKGFEEYANTWYKNNKISWKPKVQRDFLGVMNRHLIPYFKDKKVNEITKWNVQEFRNSLAELEGIRKGQKISNKSINNYMAILRRIMNEASEQYDFTTPFTKLKSLPVTETEIVPFSLEEVSQFLEIVPAKFHDYYVVRFFTGMRTGEIDGLKWRYVDFKGKKILVRETLPCNSRRWGSPKTPRSVRDIDMSKIVEEALMRQKERTENGDLVFCTKGGSPLDSSNMGKWVWYPTLKRAGLFRRKPYQTRHTTATIWLASGENPEWVARQLGHVNAEMLFKSYSRFIPNLTRKDGTAFEKLLNEKLSGKEKNGKAEDDIAADSFSQN